MKCNFCKKSNEEVCLLITGNGSFVCDECIELGVSMIIDSYRKLNKSSTSIEWIESFCTDPRDGIRYYVRVDKNDYKNEYDAYEDAHNRAQYLANRG